MANRGICGSLSSIPVEMGDCGAAYVDISPVTPNLCFRIPLIATGGAKPLSLSLLYNEITAQSSSGGPFPGGFRLNLYRLLPTPVVPLAALSTECADGPSRSYATGAGGRFRSPEDPVSLAWASSAPTRYRAYLNETDYLEYSVLNPYPLSCSSSTAGTPAFTMSGGPYIGPASISLEGGRRVVFSCPSDQGSRCVEVREEKEESGSWRALQTIRLQYASGDSPALSRITAYLGSPGQSDLPFRDVSFSKGQLVTAAFSYSGHRLTSASLTSISYRTDAPMLIDRISSPASLGGHYASLSYMGRSVTGITVQGNFPMTPCSFSYDARGRRASKVSNGVTHSYFYEGSTLIRESISGSPSHDLRFFYHMSRAPAFMTLDGVAYYYVVDAFGSVVGLVDGDGSLVVTYSYDPWGKILSTTDTSGVGLANLNPLRYRSYYYDSETGWYLCGSRYYSPEWMRWVTPDSVDYLDPETPGGLDPYAYCYGDPVNHTDATGCIPDWAKWLIGGGVILGLGIATFFTGGAAGVIFGAAFYGAVIGAVGGAAIGGLVQGGITAADGGDFWEGFAHGAAGGFMWGAIIGGATSAATAGLNIATGSVQIIGSAQKTGYLFHRFVSNINAGRFALQIGKYSTISLNRSLKSVGLNGGLRPDVLAMGPNGIRVIEVVSKTQTILGQGLKIQYMASLNPGLLGIAVDWFFGGWFYF